MTAHHAANATAGDLDIDGDMEGTATRCVRTLLCEESRSSEKRLKIFAPRPGSRSGKPNELLRLDNLGNLPMVM
jgi:hypothetical protein